VITRYWLRSPDATTTNPAGLLPKAPSGILVCRAIFPWGQLDELALTRLLANYGG
jgi:hypothetical protein